MKYQINKNVEDEQVAKKSKDILWFDSFSIFVIPLVETNLEF